MGVSRTTKNLGPIARPGANRRKAGLGGSGSQPARDFNMNDLRTGGSWKEIKAKLKQRYPDLTDDDLTFSSGKEEALLARVQKRLGMSSEELRQIIRDL